MNGSPLVSIAIFLLCYLPLAVPLYWVTQPHDPLPASSPPSAVDTDLISAERHTARLFVQSAHPWEQLTLTIDGETKVAWNGPAKEHELAIECHATCDVFIDVKWSQETPETAIRIEIQPDYYETQAYTVWGFGQLRETFTFQWNHE